MDEMTAVEYLKEKRRMTKNCSICFDCPLSYKNNGMNLSCCDFEILFYEESISIVQKFAEEHPQKTILQDFFEKHPSAPIGDFGVPKTCPDIIGYPARKHARCSGKCYECWNRPLEE